MRVKKKLFYVLLCYDIRLCEKRKPGTCVHGLETQIKGERQQKRDKKRKQPERINQKKTETETETEMDKSRVEQKRKMKDLIIED